MDPIKEAFSKIKQEINTLKQELLEIQTKINNLSLNPTIPTYTPTETPISTDRQTDRQTNNKPNYPLERLYHPNSYSSIGNRGVPTDRQTDRQTDRHMENLSKTPHLQENTKYMEFPQDELNSPQKDPISEFQKAKEILSSLDNIKKEIRHKFKSLTPQEMLVFNTLYALEEQKTPQITYKLLANNIGLSESSIRDYTNKLIKKGIPIEKTKQNNKTITLKISSDLRNVATLDTIIQLREL